MAKVRNVEYYQYLFVGTGTEFDMKKLYQAARESDSCCGFPARTAAAYQVWASNVLRRLEKEPGVVTITRTSSGLYEKIVIHDVEKAIHVLGRGSDAKTESPKETPKPVVAPVSTDPVKIEFFTSDEDKLCVVAKALRYAVRESRGGDEAKIEPDKLREACLHKERFPEIPEILQYFSEVGMELSIPTISEKERKVVFRGHCTGLKKVCAKGKPAYPRWTKLWNFENACDDEKILAAALETIRAEEAKTKKPAAKPISTDMVLTDDDKFRIFVIGGYLMDRMVETHENASITQLASALEKKGKGLSTLRLEALISSTPEFLIDDDEVYLNLGKEDRKIFWDKFRKKYRPLSGETEQIILKAWMDLEYVSNELKNCQVSLVDELPGGFNIFRINLPKNSICARYSFAELMKELREHKGEKIYTESKLIDSLKAMREKKNAAWKFQDDLYRWEIGMFGKKGV